MPLRADVFGKEAQAAFLRPLVVNMLRELDAEHIYDLLWTGCPRHIQVTRDGRVQPVLRRRRELADPTPNTGVLAVLHSEHN